MRGLLTQRNVKRAIGSETQGTTLMPPRNFSAELLLVIAFQQHLFAGGIDAISHQSEAAQHMMDIRLLSHIEQEQMRRSREIRMKSDAYKSTLPVIIQSPGKIERGSGHKPPILPNSQWSGLIRNENTAIWRHRERGYGIEFFRERVTRKTLRKF